MRGARLGTLCALGALLLALELRLRGETDLALQVAGQLVAFALFAAAAAIVWRGLGRSRAGLVVVLVLAAAFRAAAFVPGDATPPLSSDVHRYAWDARVQAAGINPYRLAPLDERLRPLREGDDAVWPGINHPAWPTIYPPAAEGSFLLSRSVFGGGLRASTWLFLIAEAGAVALLLLVLARARMPLERILVYAWHPLAISEIAANGHVDALVVLALAGLLAAWQARRPALAGAAIALAALVKLWPVMLLAALARRGGRRLVGTATALIALAYVPYLAVGTGVLGSLGLLLAEDRFNGSLQPLLAAAVGPTGAAVALGAGFAALVALVASREHAAIEEVARSALLVLGALILLATYVQPWYALALVPLMCLTAAPGWLWLTGALPLAYLNGVDRTLPWWVQPAIYGPLAAWALWRAWRGRRIPAARRPDPIPRPRIAAVIPALDEEEGIRALLAEWPAGLVDEVVVVDGGSSDGTREAARAGGARVVVERRRGYGRACAAGAAAASADVIVFLDGDGSDDPANLGRVLDPVLAGRAHLSLGARRPEPGAMPPHQALGNRLVALLIRAVHGVRVRDVPPMRAIRRDALDALGLREMTYGWPTEMIVQAARQGMTIAEVESGFRSRRAGVSKVSGRLWPSVRAGALMLAVTLRGAGRRPIAGEGKA